MYVYLYVYTHTNTHRASLMAQWVENPLTMQETQEARVRSLGWEDLLEEGMETHYQYSCLENPMDRRA